MTMASKHPQEQQEQQQQQQQEGSMAKQLSVPEALLQMQQAVRRGDMQQAAAIGATAAMPLSIRLDDLHLLGEIAQGAEATVLYGSLHNVTDVAVKRFKIHQADDLKRFRRELTILAQLSPHPNIVPLLGARALPPDYVMVMPLAASTLHARLYQFGWRPNAVELLQLALQAAEGLAAVHAAGLVHRDLKPSNMLLSDQGQLWLSDFGLAAPVEEVVQQSTLSVGLVRSRGKPTGGFLKRSMAGTLEYMAPEVLQKQPASHASDVYALAITINELATGVSPFSDCTKDNPDIHTVLEHGYGRQELATAVAAEGLRPSLPKNDATVPPGLVQLLQSAWDLNPAARPSIQEFRTRLAAMLEQALQQQQQQPCGSGGHSLAAPMEVDLSAVTNAVINGRRFFQSVGGSSSRSGCGSDDIVINGVTAEEDSYSEAGTFGTESWHQPGSAAAAGGGGSSSSSSVVLSLSSSRSRSSSYQSLGSLSTAAGGSSGGGSSGRKGRVPRTSTGSLSTLSLEFSGLNGSSVGGNSSIVAGLAAGKALSTEAANAAAAAAAAAAVPAAAASQHSVLSHVAAAAGQQQPAAVVEAGAFGALGPREAMEDRHVVVTGLGGDANVTLAAVFDGHRGHEAAAYAAAQLPRNLLFAAVDVGMRSSSVDDAGAAAAAGRPEPAPDSSSGPAAALKQAFVSTDAAFWQEWQAEMHASAVVGQYAERYPGCTALAAVVAARQLYIANAGDGRAVLSRGGTAVPLSRQHTADLADERARVMAAGGTVVYRGGSWRVGPAALQVTRALGDFDLKQPGQQQAPGQQQYSRLPGQLAGPVCLLGCRSPYHPHHQQQQQEEEGEGATDANDGSCSSSSPMLPVTAEPEVVSLQLQPSDQFLVLGTDGLWDVLNDQEAVGLVNDTVKDPALCAKRLVQEALARGSNDNVTAVVVFLQPKSTLESVWKGSSGAAVPAAQPTFYGSRRQTTPQLVQQQEEQHGGGGCRAAGGAAGVADELMDTY